MTPQPPNTLPVSEEEQPQKPPTAEQMLSIVQRLKAEGRFPSPELLNQVMQEARNKTAAELKRLRAQERNPQLG